MYWYMHALDALSTCSWDAGDGGETCTRTLTMLQAHEKVVLDLDLLI
jgi:hypothetical protein